MPVNAVAASRLEKVALDNGFDRELGPDGGWLAFASSQTPMRLWLTAADDLLWLAAFSFPHVASALSEWGDPLLPPWPAGACGGRVVAGAADLHTLVRRAFQLSRTLPDALLQQYEAATAVLPRSTEVERLAIQRVGQDLFRRGLFDYWDGRCAVTGLTVPELLRASHIKPWADCASDAERLDVFNGLLLAPHLDAAFDTGFITFDNSGALVVSARLDSDSRASLALTPRMTLRLDARHVPYLEHHRTRIFRQSRP